MIRERLPRTRGWQGADLLVLTGLLAWVAAQFLPAYSHRAVLSSEVVATSGFVVTFAGWSGALLGNEPILVRGWTANLWFLGAVLARQTRHHRAALLFAVAAELAALLGIWALATLDTLANVVGLEIGAYVWLVGITAVLAGIANWFVRRWSRR